MTEFSEAERQLLIAVVETTRKKKTPNKINLEGFGRDWFGKNLLSWDEAFGSLNEKKLLQEKDGVYSLVGEGETHAKRIRNEFSSQEFSKTLIRAEGSEARASMRACLWKRPLSI